MPKPTTKGEPEAGINDGKHILRNKVLDEATVSIGGLVCMATKFASNTKVGELPHIR